MRSRPILHLMQLGVFSGGAIDWKGRQLVLYTGVMKEGDGEIQQQCLALGDGENYQKAAHVVIDCEQQPEGFSRRDFRDPCLFEKNGILYALIAGRGSNGHGRLLLYSNAHPEDSASAWEYVQTIAENDGRLGSMWECPNIFELDGKTVIIISPQCAQQARDNRYHCGNDTAALIGPLGWPEYTVRAQKATVLWIMVWIFMPRKRCLHRMAEE